MAEVNKVGNQPIPVEQQVQKANDAVEKLPAQIQPEQAGEQPAGLGNAGQPVGLPPKIPLTQNALMSGVLTGRDASQIIAADKMRSNGGASATDVLLGLNQQPSVLGGLLAPPGNLDVLRHITPTMRRTILRSLLSKQRGEMRRLVAVARDEEQQQQRQDENHDAEDSDSPETLLPIPTSNSLQPEFHNKRVYQDLASTTKMLDLLDELLNMQDYTLSQMGTFAQG